MADDLNAYVLWYRYSDGSGAGVLKAYLDEQRASEDYNLLSSVDDSKKYDIAEVSLYGDAPVSE